MRAIAGQDIVGKYLVKSKYSQGMYTDNPREAIWEANRLPNREVLNICGEREIYKDENGVWKIRK